jgi:hypothetical protein
MSLGICLGKAAFRCPKCHRELEAYMPDRAHPFWSLERPRENQFIGSVLREIKKCDSPYCDGKVAIYWYNRHILVTS